MPLLLKNRRPQARALSLLGMLSVLVLNSQTISQAQGPPRPPKVFRELAVCERGRSGNMDTANAQLIAGGRVLLTSSGPEGLAGFGVEGLQETPLVDLLTMSMLWEPPAADVGTLFLRIATTDGKFQVFTIGSTTDQKLPNIPFDSVDGVTRLVNIQKKSLLGPQSRLTNDDVIDKVSFYFKAIKSGPSQKLFVDSFNYFGRQTKLLLDLGDCDTLL